MWEIVSTKVLQCSTCSTLSLESIAVQGLHCGRELYIGVLAQLTRLTTPHELMEMCDYFKVMPHCLCTFMKRAVERCADCTWLYANNQGMTHSCTHLLPQKRTGSVVCKQRRSNGLYEHMLTGSAVW